MGTVPDKRNSVHMRRHKTVRRLYIAVGEDRSKHKRKAVNAFWSCIRRFCIAIGGDSSWQQRKNFAKRFNFACQDETGMLFLRSCHWILSEVFKFTYFCLISKIQSQFSRFFQCHWEPCRKSFTYLAKAIDCSDVATLSSITSFIFWMNLSCALNALILVAPFSDSSKRLLIGDLRTEAIRFICLPERM